MAKATEALDYTGERCTSVGATELSIPAAPQTATAVWGRYKNFRQLVAYVLTEDMELAVQTVKEKGYCGLDWETELVTLLPADK